jgi:hypothetical protein
MIPQLITHRGIIIATLAAGHAEAQWAAKAAAEFSAQ